MREKDPELMRPIPNDRRENRIDGDSPRAFALSSPVSLDLSRVSRLSRLSRFLPVTALGLVLAAAVALACQVPVFRYALERWEPDDYEVVVVGSDRLDPAQAAAVDYLKAGRADAEAPANIRVRNAAPDAPGEKPRLDLYYPGTLREFLRDPFWTGDITMENVRAILHSPVRTQIARKLLEGDSAVWILIETGDGERDDAAAADLAGFADAAKAALRIPDGVVGASEVANPAALSPADAENVLASDVPLKIDFSVLRLSRADPAEEILLALLLSVEDDLGDFAGEPMAFAAFGRGRILQPLIGNGVTAENVMFDSSYLCGACSCQVKEQNPGIDLLLAAPWDDALEGTRFVVDKALPPLEGTAALTQAAPGGQAPATAPSDSAGQPAPGSRSLVSTPLLAAAALLAVILVGVIALTLKLRSKSS